MQKALQPGPNRRAAAMTARAGVSICGADSTAGECDCTAPTEIPGADGAQGGAAPTGAGPGAADPAGAGDGTVGDAGAIPVDDDAGADEPSGEGAEEEPAPGLPPGPASDGTPLASCDNDRDCNQGLGCFNAGDSGGFCTAPCSPNDDCDALMGVESGCGPGGLCVVACDGPDDSASCPAGMGCAQTGGRRAWHCKWVPVEEASQGPFAQCEQSEDCDGNLECSDQGMPARFGFCTRTCQRPRDCNMMVATGSLEPSCEVVTVDPEAAVCALACDGMPDGCPDGMECVDGAGFSRCMYPTR